MLEYQLQIYLIIGVVSFLIAGMILAMSIMAYYLIKLYDKVMSEAKENAYLRYCIGLLPALV
jgi:uncharacterized protein (UPF0333 family)